MGLVDELKADQGKPTSCGVCTYLRTRPEAEQIEWDEALMDRSFTHASIQRALDRRAEGIVSRSSIENHRNNRHKLLLR